jgi:hypothetical protein
MDVDDVREAALALLDELAGVRVSATNPVRAFDDKKLT